ncbi:MAG: amino acid adenylation domain-containing protein [Candidatus Aminicenantes bacterium]|nr:amino acid adenylation domain-containing protein [Candidatus Aminicenantes bacterium]
MIDKDTFDRLWLAAGQKVEERKYWLEKLAGELVKSSFPTIYKESGVTKKSEDAQEAPRSVKDRDAVELIFSRELSARLIKLSTASDIRLHIVLTAVLTLLLGKYTGNDDILTASPLLKSDADEDKGESLINKVLILRNALTAGMSFKELLLQVRQTLVEADEHRHYPIEVLLKQLNLSGPPFAAALLLENIHDREYLSLVEPEVIFSFSRSEDSISGQVEYSASSYDKGTIERIAGHFRRLVEVVLDSPEIQAAEVELLSTEEKKQLLVEFNHPQEEFPVDKTIPGLFEKQVVKTPDNIAVTGIPGSETNAVLSYRELNEEAGNLAALLVKKGVQPGDIVGLMVERSIGMIVGIIGILKSGAAYLPINPKSPGVRTAYMLRDCSAALLLTSGNLFKEAAGLGDWQGETIFINAPDEFKTGVEAQVEVDEKKGTGNHDASLTRKRMKLSKSFDQTFSKVWPPAGPPEARQSNVMTGQFTHLSSSSYPAYIIYTSGSTGIPKGVPITHGNFCPLMFWGYRHSGLGPGDRVIQNLSYYFDWSVWEIFIALTSGSGLYMINEEILLTPGAEVNFILENKITALHITPTQYRYLIDVGKKLDTLKYLAIGAEKLTYDLLVRSFESVNEDCRVFNMYGPTEATIMAAVLEIDRAIIPGYKELSSVPIGETIANTSLLVLDKHMKLCPIGVTGELYIGGDGLSQGYLNNPGLSAEKFITAPAFSIQLQPGHPSPLTPHPSPFTIYRTGDRARWLPDGTVEFLGRVDFQVKIRGYRIEPGEIENRLLNHQQVKEALVMARQYENGENYLCAYIVAQQAEGIQRGAAEAVQSDKSGEQSRELSPAHLREYLSAQLPDYMVPSYFVFLDKMPLSPNGKVDLKALPEPQVGRGTVPYAAPRDDTEKKLAQIWSEVLELDEAPGIDDNFFESGGHSLKATTLTSAIYKEFTVNIEIQEVFRQPTVRELARLVRGLEELEYAAITPVKEEEHYALSYAQRRLWILCQFEEDSTAYNMPLALTISGDLDVEAFERALQALIERHESLRTVFVTVDGDPRQKIINIKDFESTIEQVDLRSLEEKARQEEARKLYTAAANRVFDLESGPLFLFKLVKIEEKKYIFIYNIHHIVNDGWSQGIISRELVTLYNCFSRGEENPLLPLELQYKDYTHWHNRLIESGGFAESRDYWLEKFKDKPNGTELPFDHPRKAVQTFNGGRVSFVFDGQKTSKLFRISQEEDATLFMVLLTLVNVFLYRYTGQSDIIVGAPIANRKRPELSNIVGFLVNTLVYRCEVNPAHSFRQQLAQVKQEALDCYRYQDYPFDLLVEQSDLERDMSQSPLFNVMLAHNNAAAEDLESAFEGVHISGYEYSDDFNMSKFDLIFFMDEVGDRVQTRIEYNSDLFERSAIERMAGNFMTLVDHVVSDAAVTVSGLNITTGSEYDRVTRLFNDTRCEFSPLTLQEIFEKQVEKTPGKIAVIGIAGGNYKSQNTNYKIPGGSGPTGIPNSESQTAKKSRPAVITYRDLNKEANRFAHFLREEHQVKSNYVIGVSMDRSIEMIIVLLGIIKSGAAYLAVDPTYPADRVAHVLADSKAALLVSDKMRPELFAGYAGEILDITVLADKIAEKSSRNPTVVNQPADILYVNYTSGSTGTPNGAMLSHDCLTNLIRWQNEKTAIDCSMRVLQFTSINFCVSFQEIMGALTSGGELHLIGDIERQDIDYLMSFLSEQQIEVLFLPFSYLNFLFNESGRWDRAFKHNLEHIVTAGEQLKITAGLKRFLDANPHIQLHNHYGSTEMHVVTSYTLDASTAARTPIPPAGKPISNIKIFILDEFFNVAPLGVYGELCVAGSLELPGYIDNEELTAEKSISCPRLSDVKLYRSGDIGRWLPDGNIELRGRKDFMVKVRGFRVEPGEIESKILAVEKVRECVVVVREDEAGQKYLVAYVSLENIEAAQIKRIITNELPQYMIPKIVVLESLPLMPNGKVDREQLPDPDLSAEEDRVIVPPGNEVERKLAAIWSRLIGIEVEQVSIDDNFFELGGHSLKATIMMAEIHKELEVKVDLVEIFKAPTIKEIASLIDDIRWLSQGRAESGQEVEEVII